MEQKYVSQEIAEQILGRNFRSIQCVRKTFNRPFSKQERKKLELVPYSEETLKKYAEDHCLIPYVETNLIAIKPAISDTMFDGARNWYLDPQSSCQEKTSIGWKLIRKECFFESLGKTYEDQLASTPEDHEPILASDFIYFLALELKLRYDPAFLKYWATKACARTKSFCNSLSLMVDLSYCCIFINGAKRDFVSADLGLITAVKPE